MTARHLPIMVCASLFATAVCAAPSRIGMQRDIHGCRLLVPADFSEGKLEWVGHCRGGLADGFGVLRANSEAEGLQLFYGAMRQGMPVSGYLETGSSNTHGPVLTFRGAQALPTRGRAEDRAVCRIAAQGSDAAALHYRALHNSASAQLYTTQAANFRICDPRMGE